ncbi:MAG: amidohydrolase [Chloroflexi bacterium]|nr:amidohydrolase [Chloroflexota bacterium]
MSKYAIIDADGHILESVPGIREFLEPRWQRKALFPSDVWDRDLRGKLGHTPKGPQDHLTAQEVDGIDTMVLYPTAGLGFGTLRETDFAVALARAYNDWLYHFCLADPARLKFAALIPVQDPPSAAEELRRAVTQLGAVGAMLPTNVPQRPDWGHRSFDPIYAEAERLDIGLSFHATLRESVGLQRFENFINIHTVGHPVEQIMALCGSVVGGVFERFPRLRIAYLEAGIGWVPYMMDRLDEEVEKRGADEAPYLTRLPSEYIRSGRIFFGVECEEKTLPDGVRWGLEDTLLYSSDYPHWDADWPGTVRAVVERDDLSESVKRKMLHANAARFYGPRVLAGLETPVAEAA